MDDINKIKDRIAKLLAMAADTSSPEEAAIAMQRARRLMDKHQIDEAQIRGFRESLAEKEYTSVWHGKRYKYRPRWMIILAYAVAQYNDCQQWINDGRILFRGFTDDVAMSVQMFDRLCAQVDSWCRLYMKTIGEGSHYKASIGNPYKFGMAQRIISKLNSLRAERDQISDSAGNSLVVIKAELVATHFGEEQRAKGVNMHRAKGREDEADLHRTMGWLDGESVQVNEQLSE
ncbi:hypothetical protein [Burkholderia phage BCSR129]|nr:hypothetical protein [Burkholderia phage BCSR129]